MNFLVIGKGGREHAIVKSLIESPSVERVYALPGSAGMGPIVERLSDVELSADAISKACEGAQIQYVIIGPEDPLVSGLATELRERGLHVFGPGQRGAQLEGSKVLSKEFMSKYKIPTAPFHRVSSVSDVEEVVAHYKPPYVLKADGLAAGKGVFICDTKEELFEAAQNLFENKILGEAGREALIEQFQPGYELSYFILTNSKDWVALPLAQDHKKLSDGGKGPNTGGMGTVAPMKIDEALEEEIRQKVVEPTVAGLQEESFDYRGVLFIGLMITESGPQVLEFNVRFGDPETQVLLPLMDGDWGQVFKDVSEARIPELKWKNKAAACVVLAAENYPGSPVKGVKIQGPLSDADDSHYFLHAGTALDQDQWLTHGGRVLNAMGLGDNLNEAIQRAYSQVSKVSWEGMQFRKDIGSKAEELS